MGSGELSSITTPGSGKPGPPKRAKRSSSSDKSRQPQRGLGVAQLEKIRLHTQLATTGYFSSFHPNATPIHCNFMDGDLGMGMGMAFSAPSSSCDPSPSIFGLPPDFMMGVRDLNGRDVRLHDPHPCYPSSGVNITSTCSMNYTTHSFQQPTPPTITLPLLRQRQSEDWVHKRRRYEWSESIGSSSRGEASKEELDLDLKLSL